MEYFANEQNTFINTIHYGDLADITVEKFKQTMTITPSEYALLFNKYKRFIEEYPHNNLHIYSFMMCLKYAEMTSVERKHLSDFYDEKYKEILSKESLEKTQELSSNKYDPIISNILRNIETNFTNVIDKKRKQCKLTQTVFSELYSGYINLLYININEIYSQQIHENKKYIYFAEPKNMIKKFDAIDTYQIALVKDLFVKFAEFIFANNYLTDKDIETILKTKKSSADIISENLVKEICNLYKTENWELFIPLMNVCVLEIYKYKKLSNTLPNNIKINEKLKEKISYLTKEDKQRFFEQNNFINCINKVMIDYIKTTENNSTKATALMLYFAMLWNL